jgi:hypothetical protein
VQSYTKAQAATGFDGTIDEYEWAMFQDSASNTGTVRSVDALAVTAVEGRRMVGVAAGRCYAAGVDATFYEGTTIEFPTPPAGGMWYAIGVARNWESNTVEIVRVDGYGSDDKLPLSHPPLEGSPELQQYFLPGAFTIQVLAWCWVNATNLNVQVWDMRKLAPQPIPIAEKELRIAHGDRYNTAVVVADGSFQTVKTVKFFTEEPVRINVIGYMRWVSKGISAGYHLITLNGKQVTQGRRAHNDGVGANYQQPADVSGWGITRAGENTIELVCTAEATLRYVGDVELSAYVV